MFFAIPPLVQFADMILTTRYWRKGKSSEKRTFCLRTCWYCVIWRKEKQLNPVGNTSTGRTDRATGRCASIYRFDLQKRLLPIFRALQIRDPKKAEITLKYFLIYCIDIGKREKKQVKFKSIRKTNKNVLCCFWYWSNEHYRTALSIFVLFIRALFTTWRELSYWVVLCRTLWKKVLCFCRK